MYSHVVVVVGYQYMINDQYPVHAAGRMTTWAVSHVSNCAPMIVPTDPEIASVSELIEICDGFVFTGGRPNVHPEEYGEVATEAHGDFDRGRDAIALGIIRACVDAVNRYLGFAGFQEVAVAMGSTLHPEIRDLPGRDNHRMPPDGTMEEKFALRHVVTVSENGPFHNVFGATEVLTNTLHGQGIERAGDRIVIDGYAPDGTPEAIYVKDAPGFTLSVQWHPEWNADQDPVSRPLFRPSVRRPMTMPRRALPNPSASNDGST